MSVVIKNSTKFFRCIINYTGERSLQIIVYLMPLQITFFCREASWLVVIVLCIGKTSATFESNLDFIHRMAEAIRRNPVLVLDSLHKQKMTVEVKRTSSASLAAFENSKLVKFLGFLRDRCFSSVSSRYVSLIPVHVARFGNTVLQQKSVTRSKVSTDLRQKAHLDISF